MEAIRLQSPGFWAVTSPVLEGAPVGDTRRLIRWHCGGAALSFPLDFSRDEFGSSWLHHAQLQSLKCMQVWTKQAELRALIPRTKLQGRLSISVWSGESWLIRRDSGSPGELEGPPQLLGSETEMQHPAVCRGHSKPAKPPCYGWMGEFWTEEGQEKKSPGSSPFSALTGNSDISVSHLILWSHWLQEELLLISTDAPGIPGSLPEP